MSGLRFTSPLCERKLTTRTLPSELANLWCRTRTRPILPQPQIPSTHLQREARQNGLVQPPVHCICNLSYSRVDLGRSRLRMVVLSRSTSPNRWTRWNHSLRLPRTLHDPSNCPLLRLHPLELNCRQPPLLPSFNHGLSYPVLLSDLSPVSCRG